MTKPGGWGSEMESEGARDDNESLRGGYGGRSVRGEGWE